MNKFKEKMLEKDIEYIKNVSLKKYTTIKIGGLTRYIVFPKNNNELILILELIKQENYNYFVLGNGSNVLFEEGEFEGIIISTKKLNVDYKVDNNIVEVGAGHLAISLSLKLAKLNLSGMEFISGIPGTMGGLVYMNAGAYKVEMKDILLDVTIIDENNKLRKISPNECEFSYRKSIFHSKEWIIVSARFKLIEKPKEEIIKKINSRKEYRLKTQPLDKPNSGSTFVNCAASSLHAWEIIDKLNLRGYTHKGIAFSEKHANFLINVGDAKSTDVEEIIELATKKAKKELNLELKPEVRIIKWNK